MCNTFDLVSGQLLRSFDWYGKSTVPLASLEIHPLSRTQLPLTGSVHSPDRRKLYCLSGAGGTVSLCHWAAARPCQHRRALICFDHIRSAWEALHSRSAVRIEADGGSQTAQIDPKTEMLPQPVVMAEYSVRYLHEYTYTVYLSVCIERNHASVANTCIYASQCSESGLPSRTGIPRLGPARRGISTKRPELLAAHVEPRRREEASECSLAPFTLIDNPNSTILIEIPFPRVPAKIRSFDNHPPAQYPSATRRPMACTIDFLSQFFFVYFFFIDNSWITI